MSSLIEVKGLSKSFGDLHVLENVKLEVRKGERIAIIGGSGCGKSVFLRCLELLEKPDKGQIFIDGDEITAKGADAAKIRRKMGMVYQQFYLFSHLDVMDNLCLAPVKVKGVSRTEAEEQARYWLSQVGLSSKEHAMPDTLSGGQKQRIAICRSLMMDPKVLLFDEPTSALDPTMAGEVLAMIRMLGKRDMTMLIVTHEMKFAREVANRVLFLADKGIYEEGTPEEIFDHPKREKTVAFVHRLKFIHYEIHERNFDLMELQGHIEMFREKYNISRTLSMRLQLCCEELIYEMLAGCYRKEEKDIDVIMDISYSDVDGTCSIQIQSGGSRFDPFSDITEDDPGVHLGVEIVKRVSKHHECSFSEGRNILKVQL